MDIKHEIIQDLKRIASELGHVPSRAEYISNRLGKFSVDRIIKVFGGWTIGLQAAGLKQTREESKLEIKNIFYKDIKEVVVPKKEIIVPKKSEPFLPTLFIGDTHHPFSDQEAFCLLYEFAERKQPKRIIQMGDLFDMFAHSKFPRSRNTYNPFEEIELGYEMASKMWKTLQEICPQAECHQILGNHDLRPLKRILEVAPDQEVFIQDGFYKYFKFENVTSHLDPREELDLGKCIVSHGYFNKPGQHMEYARRSFWRAHSHMAYVIYKRYGDQILYEANPGFMGDMKSKAMSYMHTKMTHHTLGWGWDDEEGPRALVI